MKTYTGYPQLRAMNHPVEAGRVSNAFLCRPGNGVLVLGLDRVHDGGDANSTLLHQVRIGHDEDPVLVPADGLDFAHAPQ